MADSYLTYIKTDTQELVKVRLQDNGDGTFSLATTATLASDIQIGSVEIKNAADDTRAKVAAGTAVTEADNALATKDAGLGLTTDVEATGNGTLLAITKRLRTLLSGGLPAALTAGGSLKTALVEAIVAGANRIGKVTIRNAADAADIDPLAEGTFTGRIGEVQASPTANTLLARLKDLLTGIILAAGANLIGKVQLRNPGNTVDLGDATNPVRVDPTGGTTQPVSGPLTDTQLRAAAVPVSGPLTDTQLRATAVPVSGPLTDTQLRATAVPVSGPLTDTQLRATAVPTDVSDRAARDLGKVDVALLDQYTPFDQDTGAGTVNALPVTLRKSAAGGPEFGTAADPLRTDPTGTTTQPVSGPLTDTQLRASAVPVSGPLTDTQLRATAVPVSGTVIANQGLAHATEKWRASVIDPLPAGANNIGDVDVLTVPAPLSTTGGGVEATALRVTVASDSTGLLSVDDNAGSLTVDAPVATPVFVRLSDGAAAQGSQAAPLFARISDGTDANLVTAAGELNVLASAQPGVDIGDVTINNAAGAAAVNIQDGGNSITVDGTITADSNRGALTDRSGTITLGGTSQQLAAANATRKYLLIQNNSDTTLWANFNVAAVENQPSIRLLSGDTLVFESGFIPTEAVHIIGPTTGKTFTAKEA